MSPPTNESRPRKTEDGNFQAGRPEPTVQEPSDNRRPFDRARYQASCWHDYLSEPLTLIDGAPCIGRCQAMTLVELQSVRRRHGVCPCSLDYGLEVA